MGYLRNSSKFRGFGTDYFVFIYVKIFKKQDSNDYAATINKTFFGEAG
jgi:hypothetical protein